ncbi:thiolase [Basidiobolus meristosporus CBS 931.73]|uniref:Thiolase n=1 Tax=Basidiobolus meristosporus CBS 931.73 TaxID=1314790 RepID=A0A1Y1XDG0_9FUNG|nr:thiolase [Basidiobolus meristosporus CBS 931.73]|eukprot:ORX83757.1 thiolase [Basidiobolus meristosporus CBS 931.73]
MSSNANQRLGQLASHISTTATPTKIGVKSPDDVVIVSALRTPITRARKGGFKDVHAEELLGAVLKATLEKTKLDPKLIDDVVVGNVLPRGGGATVARMAVLYAGIPEKAAVMTVNRQCSSGLQAVVQVASSIQSGLIDIGIGAGTESMTLDYGPTASPDTVSDKVSAVEAAADCLIPMGITSENVAKQFGVSREKQDQMAVESHAKAAKAQEEGLFDEEIIPVTVNTTDKEGNEKEITVKADDGIRRGVDLASLSKLRPAFSKTGTTTAGNASQVSDGAAAVLLMKRKTAEKLNLPILGKYVSAAVVGVPPNVMGIGPAFAIPAAVKKAGIQVQDLDIIELNEAFASQAVYCIETLKLDPKKVNPKGGALALGHPLGCTGARQIATLLPELKRQGKKVGAVSMCIGTGMGMCGIFERE